MKTFNEGQYKKCRDFIYRNARPIDFARFRYHFEDGGRKAVICALAAYQNADGGFAHALEADSWNVESSPIQTWAATEILREIDFSDAEHPIIRGILRYLASGRHFNGHFWYTSIKSNNDYPHAQWWKTESDSTCNNYNPTACLAGFILNFADKQSELYRIGKRVAREAVECYFSGDFLADTHTASCYIRLWEYGAAGNSTIADFHLLGNELKKQVTHNINRNIADWLDYACRPSDFICGRDSVFYPDNKEIAEAECDYIIGTQRDDGTWRIPWGWKDYPEQWAIAKNWWKSHVIIQNLLYLKGFECLNTNKN